MDRRSMSSLGALLAMTASITLADIVEAVEGPIAMTSCVDAENHDCAIEGNCRVKPHWSAVNQAVRGAPGDRTAAAAAHSMTLPTSATSR